MKPTKKELKRRRSNTRARWKAVERSVAAALSKIYSDVGKSPVERIPILGREGPDLTVNEVGLVINVKSRGSISDKLFPAAFTLLPIGDFVCFRLEHLPIAAHYTPQTPVEPTKDLEDWYALMDKWTKEFKPDGITCIILHRPRMPIGKCGVVIHQNDLRRLSCHLNATTS